ncbi:MAG: YCII-related protein [Gemmatimonadetes bacterium]|nr:YCII-related protein [Gemmatimonadota bacterium]
MHVADPRQVPANVFLYTLHPVRTAMLTEGPTPEEQALAGQHWAYSTQLLAAGTIIFAGRTLTRDADSFASVVIRAESEDAARAVMEDDPAVRGGVFRARLFPYQPMLMGAWPPEAATASPPGAGAGAL